MKNLRQLCVAVVLTLIAAVHTFAGQIPTTITDPPPPASATSMMIDGQIHTTSGEAADPVAEIAISLLQSVLPLF